MKIVVGLGNPGRQYDGTRHNVGWMVLDRIADRAGWSGRAKERDAASVARGRYADTDMVLVKPTTYMNLSGLAVRKVLARERVPMADLLVIVDDFALPLGRLRLREEGSAGGHNGLKSIIAEMGTQRFARLRVGIGEPGQNAVDHVLTRFAPSEQADLAKVLDAAAEAVADWARDGAGRAANRWNAWTLPSPPADPGSPGSGPDPTRTGTGPKPATPGRDATTLAEHAPAPGGKPATTPKPAAQGPKPASPGGEPANPGPAPDTRSTRSLDPAHGTDPGARTAADPGRTGPDAAGIVRTRTGWRRLLPRTGDHEERGR